jgi:hypothetical protein
VVARVRSRDAADDLVASRIVRGAEPHGLFGAVRLALRSDSNRSSWQRVLVTHGLKADR